jgi:hypothetical protein
MPVVFQTGFHAEHTNGVPGVDADGGWYFAVCEHPFDEREAVWAGAEVVVERDRLNRVVVEEVDRLGDGGGVLPACGRCAEVVEPDLYS